jgi:hypothetical protein
MTNRTLREILGRPSESIDDDRGSLMLLLLVVIVGASLGGIMLTMILNQDGSTRFDNSRVIALDTAQTGIDVALGEIRNSIAYNNDGSVSTVPSTGGPYGNDGSLPCAPPTSPISGSSNATGAATYSVSLRYYLTNPSTAGATPMGYSSGNPNGICAAGYGPYDPTTGSHTPRYAVITSVGNTGILGNSVTASRTLTTIYVFQTDDVNVSGGTIKLYPNGSGTSYCMDAGSGTPTSGTAVKLQVCSTSTPPAAQQVFAYRSDLSIQLVSSVSTTYANGLCLDTSPTTHANNVAIVLNPCSALGSAPWNQQWSVDDWGHLRGALTTDSDIDNWNITAPNQTAGTALVLTAPNLWDNTNCTVADPTHGTECVGDVQETWVPSPTVGAGMAGASNSQLVNYQQFATCLDDTNQAPTASYMILYTCKQNPNPANVLWNQKFAESPAPASVTAGPTTVLLKMADTYNGTTYCLVSPQSAGGYPTLSSPCPSSVAAATSPFKWTVYQTKDSNGNDLSYANKYIIKDGAGYCLSSGAASDLASSLYYKVIVTTCDGGTEQKWNANPSVLAAHLTDTSEN